MDEIKSKFIEEAFDLIADLEKALLELEVNPDNKDQIERVFRVMHTLKGTSSMFGFDMIGDLTHDLETIYDLIREGSATLTEEILTTTLSSIDHIKVLLENDQKVGVQAKDNHLKLTKKVLELVESIEGKGSVENKGQIQEEKKDTNDQIRTFYILFRPKTNILINGSNPLFILEDLYELGECKVTAHCSNISDFETLDPTQCYVYWDIYLATKEPVEAIKEAFMFVEGHATVEIHLVSDINILSNESFIKKVEEVEGDISAGELKEFVNNLLQIIKGKPQVEKNPSIVKESAAGSIRVATEKLDGLMNLVSELVTVQARLSLFAEQNYMPDLISITEDIEKITRQLRDNAFSICLVPFENTLTRFQRLVRDLSIELDKDIVFLTEGGETELDKTITENLVDPIMHLLRNSLDHGIETKEERIKSGKPEKARILIKAYYSGNEVHIQIKDDGRGIDPEKVKRKAIEKGLINPDAIITDKECLNLIFLPGFSTAEKITGVSGRGVGMDVVKKKITELRGQVQVDSLVGLGATITIRLPLTLSIIDGLLVKVNETFFVIPLLSVSKCFEKKHSEIVTAFNNTTVVDGEQIPFFYLRNEFNIHKNCPEIHQLVTITYENQRVGLVVDSIIGEYQAVLKPLGKLYNNIQIVSGGTILGDGTVALILDTYKIIKEFSNKILI